LEKIINYKTLLPLAVVSTPSHLGEGWGEGLNMKKKYIQPSIKAYIVETLSMIAESIVVDKNASGPAPAKGSDFFEDDEWVD